MRQKREELYKRSDGTSVKPVDTVQPTEPTEPVDTAQPTEPK